MVYNTFHSLTDSLGSALQGETMTATEAKKDAAATWQEIVYFRSDKEFSSLWERTVARAQELKLSDLMFLDHTDHQDADSGSDPYSFNSSEEYYQRIYFEDANTVHGDIQKRFWAEKL